MAAAIVPFAISGDVLHRAETHGGVCKRLPLIEELVQYLRTDSPNPRRVDGSLAYGVFGPWSIGHHIRILAGRPVVADPFNYETGDETGAALANVWLAKTTAELTTALRARGVRYLVLTNPAEEIVGTLRRAGRPTDEFVRVVDDRNVLLPTMNQFAAFRLFMNAGLSTEFGNFEPRFFSRESETYIARSQGEREGRSIAIPEGQIYEIEAGATVTGEAPEGADAVVVRFAVRFPEGSSKQVDIPLPIDSDRTFRFHTALPAPVEWNGLSHRQRLCVCNAGATGRGGSHAGNDRRRDHRPSSLAGYPLIRRHGPFCGLPRRAALAQSKPHSPLHP